MPVLARLVHAASRPLALLAVGLMASAPLAAQTITNTTGLSFGTFLAVSGGTVVVGTSGSRSKSGGVLLLGQGAGAAAQFSVSGTAHASYAITLPGDNTVTLSDGNAHTMVVNGFVSSPSGAGTLSVGGTQLLSVGATLVVGNGQPAGNYAGWYGVTVNYE